jgi:hypothetical protein|tara:strand:- start:129 stop:287 length:159 start_codon:yes stop_codon:yes gene_type:complete
MSYIILYSFIVKLAARRLLLAACAVYISFNTTLAAAAALDQLWLIPGPYPGI